MKKASSLIAFLVIAGAAITFSMTSYRNIDHPDYHSILSGHTWIFKTALSESPAAAHYMSTIYNQTTYNFRDDLTFSGEFFEFNVSGTWEINDKALILNKDTGREEVYHIEASTPQGLILSTIEKGDRVILQFEKK